MSRPNDIGCPICHGVRLHVYRTRRPKGVFTYRYRECTTCGTRTVAREKTVTVGEPRIIRKPSATGDRI